MNIWTLLKPESGDDWRPSGELPLLRMLKFAESSDCSFTFGFVCLAVRAMIRSPSLLKLPLV